VMFVLLLVVNPSFWRVSPIEFPKLYGSFTSRIALPVVIPEFLALLSVVPMFWIRPEAVPAWMVWATLGAGVLYMAITFGLHLPVHAVLAKGDNSAPVIASLVRTHALRTIVQAAKCVVVVWMLAR